MADPDEALALMSKSFMDRVPHNVALGLAVLKVTSGEATMALPYKSELVGNPDSGVMHGGAITSLMDACCGAAVFMKLRERMSIATLDLRIDYLKAATPSRRVVAHAICYKTTRSVAFVRCVAHHDDPDDLIAHAVATFMLDTRSAEVGA
jgi:uncharacterized protein (TIGR00369 family)